MSNDTQEHVEFDDDDVVIERTIYPEDNLAGKVPRTAKQLLHFMRSRQAYLGSPLPEGFVAPPGIDIAELLKQLPPRPDAPPTA